MAPPKFCQKPRRRRGRRNNRLAIPAAFQAPRPKVQKKSQEHFLPAAAQPLPHDEAIKRLHRARAKMISAFREYREVVRSTGAHEETNGRVKIITDEMMAGLTKTHRRRLQRDLRSLFDKYQELQQKKIAILRNTLRKYDLRQLIDSRKAASQEFHQRAQLKSALSELSAMSAAADSPKGPLFTPPRRPAGYVAAVPAVDTPSDEVTSVTEEIDLEIESEFDKLELGTEGDDDDAISMDAESLAD